MKMKTKEINICKFLVKFIVLDIYLVDLLYVYNVKRTINSTRSNYIYILCRCIFKLWPVGL